jgi:hypothetical protein
MFENGGVNRDCLVCSKADTGSAWALTGELIIDHSSTEIQTQIVYERRMLEI